MRRLIVVMVVCALGLLTAQSALADMVWDLLADIDTVNNPDGPWSFNAGDNGGDVFAVPTLMPLVATNWQGVGVDAWTLSGGGGDVPGFGVATVDNGGGLGQLTGDVMGHSPVIIRWTSPVSGLINISGQAFHPRDFGRVQSVILREKGEASTVAELSILGNLDTSTPRATPLVFSKDINVVPGQTVDLLVGPNQVEFFAFSQLVITHETVPEPSSAVLISSMAIGLSVYRRRRNVCRRRAA